MKYILAVILFLSITHTTYGATVYRSIQVTDEAKKAIVEQAAKDKKTQRDTASRMILEAKKYPVSEIRKDLIKLFQLIHFTTRVHDKTESLMFVEYIQKELMFQTVFEPSAVTIEALLRESPLTQEEIERFRNE